MAKQANMKRIHKVTVKRMCDESPDTSWLGEYANDPTSEFSIDRAHDLECPRQTYNRPTEAINLLERVMVHIRNVKDAHCSTVKNRTDAEKEIDMDIWSSYDDAEDICIDASTEIEEECTCGFSGHWDNRTYRYFNPSFNYVDAKGRAKDLTPDEVRKYARQDYERMEGLNSQQWGFIGIRAEADVLIPTGATANGCFVSQEITSGGLWGIESDSDAGHFAEVEKEELAELEAQLHAIGFSKRAIAAAFKDVEHVEE